jgi:drug/metabolite transporter (DMT)-like permease
MNTLVLILFSIVFLSISRVLQKLLFKGNNSNPVVFAVCYQLIVGLIIFIYALITGFNLEGYQNYILSILLSGILYTFANLFVFKAFQKTDASIATVALASSAIWTTIASIILLKETISTNQLIGLILVTLSLVLISYERKKLKLTDRGFVYGILAAILFGVAFTNDAFIIGDRDSESYLSIAFILPALLLALIQFKELKNFKSTINKNSVLKIFALGIFYALANIATFTAYQLGTNASVISPLQQLSTILTVLLAVLFLKEKDNITRKIVAAGISILGAILIIL